MDGLLEEFEMFDDAFKDIGDISGLTVLDAGPEGVASRYLAERVGEGRIVGVNVWLEAYNMVRERVGDELMSRIVFIKDDLAETNYLKGHIFDLVVSYDTLISIEAMTPSKTIPVLRQFYRTLRHNGTFLAIECYSLKEKKPENKAQEFDLIFRRILDQEKGREFGKGTYTPEELSDMLESIGFIPQHWKILEKSPPIPLETTTDLMKMLEERVMDEDKKKAFRREIKTLSEESDEIDFRYGWPYYALYAKKP